MRAENLLAAEAALSERSDAYKQTIIDVQTFGDRIDIMVTDAELGQQQIRTILEQNHLQLKDMHPDDATLENLFVNRLRQQGSDPDYLEFPSYRTGQVKGEIAIATQKLQKPLETFAPSKTSTLPCATAISSACYDLSILQNLDFYCGSYAPRLLATSSR